MSEAGEQFLEIIVGAVVLILLGTALAPLLPFNFAALGWLLLILGTAGAALVAVLTIAKAISEIG